MLPCFLLLLLIVLQATPLLPELLQRALDLVLGCPCTQPKGCPGCVQHLDCKNYNAVLSKRAGVVVLRAAIEQEAAYVRRQEQGEQQEQQEQEQEQ
jgi:DEAD/DEAH box helicase domain-containing protein